MRRLVVMLGALAAGVLLALGCGIPQEEHDATLDELKKIKAEMQQDKKTCDQDKAELEKKGKQLGDENKVMKQKLLSLGQDLGKLKTQAGTLGATLTQKEKQIADLLEAERKRLAMYADLKNKFKKMIDAGQLKVEVRKGRMNVKMSDRILFDSGKDQLKKEGKVALAEVTKILAAIPGRSFQVAGHTDNVPIKKGKFQSNWELSASRGVNVVKFMIENGMDAKRVSAAGYAESDPVGDNTTDDGKMLNRRIEITLVPTIEELPQFTE
jgi:chemotaxis protein MotB